MAYFILMGRRIPKQAITGFKFQNETDNIRPFLSIRIRGKDEIIPFKDKKEIQSVKAHLCSIFSRFVKIGDWYLKMSEVKEYYCGTCGAKDGAEHPKTGYCFHCDTDNWISKNN